MALDFRILSTTETNTEQHEMTIKAADAKHTYKLLAQKKADLIETIESLKAETNPQAVAMRTKFVVQLETISAIMDSMSGNKFNLGIL